MGLQHVFLQVVKSLLQPKIEEEHLVDMSHFDSIHYPVRTEVISNGVINSNNLEKLKLDHSWLHQQLQQLGVHSASDVLYAEVQQDGSLYINQNNDDFVH
ncbi:MAG: YetF domain-containing protein [Bacillota bacterium]